MARPHLAAGLLAEPERGVDAARGVPHALLLLAAPQRLPHLPTVRAHLRHTAAQAERLLTHSQHLMDHPGIGLCYKDLYVQHGLAWARHICRSQACAIEDLNVVYAYRRELCECAGSCGRHLLGAAPACRVAAVEGEQRARCFARIARRPVPIWGAITVAQ